MSWSGALGAAALLAVGSVLYLAAYFRWEARTTRGLAYFGRDAIERLAIRRRIARRSTLALPLVRALALLMGQRTMPSFRYRGVAGPPGISSAASFERATQYAPRPGDVFVATQMRSGTTWMQQVVYQLVTRGHGEPGAPGTPHLYALSPWLEVDDGVPVHDAPPVGNPPVRIIKTHLPASLCPFAAAAKYICVVRDPVSCFASVADFNRALVGPLLPPLAALAEWFCSDAMYWTPWPAHVSGWWEQAALHDNVLLVHFEEMTRDFGAVRERVARFLGVALTADEARRVDERCSFAYMSAHEEFFEMARPTMFSVRGARFLRDGKESRGQALPAAVRARIVGYCRAALAGSSYPVARFYPELTTPSSSVPVSAELEPMTDPTVSSASGAGLVPPGGATRSPGWRTFVTLGIVMGITYGLLEALEACVLSLVPGALAWRSGNSARILWVAPIAYGCVGLALGLVFFALSRVVRAVDWIRVFVFAALVGGGFLGAMLQGQVFSPLASILLALGLATQLTRLFGRWRERLLAATPRLVAPMVGAVAVIAALEMTTAMAREHWSLSHLPAAQARPNVLVLVADTLRADHVSAYGYARPTTPRLDALANESRLYANAYSASSWTLPAHASLMTGRRVYEHRAGHQGHPYLDRKFATLAEVMSGAGYAAGGFVSNFFWCGRQTGLDRGFVHYDDLYGNVGDALARTVLGRLLAYDVLPHFGWVDIPGRRSSADMNARLLDWIDGVRDRPFFAFVNYMDVHAPYIPPAGFDGRFSGHRLLHRPTRIELGDINPETKVRDPALLRAWIDRYDESLSYLDDQVGRLLDELARRGVLDHTIVVFTSDHGESWGEHDLMFHGHSLYQEQVRIPLLVRYPAGVPAGQRVDAPVALEQVPRMIVDLAKLDGTPFGTAMPDAAAVAGAEHVAVSEVSKRTGMPPSWPTASGGLRSVQNERWQLIVNQTGKTELYDIVADRSQLHDLAADARYASVLADMQARLQAEVPTAFGRARIAQRP